MLMRLKFRTRPAKAAMSAETLRAIWYTDDFRQRVKRQGMKVDLDHLHEDETVAALAKILGAPVSLEDLGEGQVVLTSVPDSNAHGLRGGRAVVKREVRAGSPVSWIAWS